VDHKEASGCADAHAVCFDFAPSLAGFAGFASGMIFALRPRPIAEVRQRAND
jgi:hypothetical protein